MAYEVEHKTEGKSQSNFINFHFVESSVEYFPINTVEALLLEYLNAN